LGVVLASAAKFKGYNFSIMHKTLAILALALFVFPVQAYTQTNKAQQTSKSDEPSSPVAPVVPQQRDSPKLQPEHQDHVQADVRVVSAPTKDRYDKASVWINLALVVIGAIGITAAIITLRKLERQTKATEKAVLEATASRTLAENTAKRQLRAYLVVRDAHLILHEDGAVEAKVELVNCGQTPAYDLRGAMICKFTVYPVRNVQPIQDDLRKSAGTLGAGLGNWILYPIGRHDKGNREHLLKRFVEIQGLVYYAHGIYTYRDIFNDPHWLKFQLIVGGPAGLRMDSDGVRHWASFSYDSEGNDEDQPQHPN
jgi:hypothetical protein